MTTATHVWDRNSRFIYMSFGWCCSNQLRSCLWTFYLVFKQHSVCSQAWLWRKPSVEGQKSWTLTLINFAPSPQPPLVLWETQKKIPVTGKVFSLKMQRHSSLMMARRIVEKHKLGSTEILNHQEQVESSDLKWNMEWKEHCGSPNPVGFYGYKILCLPIRLISMDTKYCVFKALKHHLPI